MFGIHLLLFLMVRSLYVKDGRSEFGPRVCCFTAVQDDAHT